jgi:DNA-binding Xre family transcriptional regulator
MLTSNLDKLLRERAWSGRELARRSGLHRDTITHWRRGVPVQFRRATLECLTAALNCTLDQLLSAAAVPEPPPVPQARPARLAQLELLLHRRGRPEC